MGLLGKAVAGGLGGYMMTGDWGGAAAGAAMGLGYRQMAAYGNKMTGKYGASSMRKGLGLMGRGVKKLEGAAWSGFEKYGGSAAGNALGHTALFANSARGGLASARSAIGQGSVKVNKFGGHALAAAGVGSAAMLGSSVLQSNRGY